MRNRMLGTWAVLIACGLLAFAGSAQAANINNLISNLVEDDGEATMIDDSFETLIVDANSDLILDVGDVLRGIFNITLVGQALPTTNQVGIGWDGTTTTAHNELSGIFQTVLLSKTAVTGGYIMTFGTDASFAEASGLGVAAANDGEAGAMVLFYEDSTPDFSSAGPAVTDDANAKNGNFYWALGFSSDLPTDDYRNETTGEFWGGFFSTDDLTAPNFQGNPIGSAFFGMNRVFANPPNNTDPVPGIGEPWVLGTRVSQEGGGLVEFTGSATVTLQASNTVWPASNQASFNFNPVSIVPVPAAAWMGFALLGALGLGRRLRRRK